MQNVQNADVLAKQKQKQFEQTIVEYANSSRGHFIVTTDDTGFIASMKTVIYKYLAINKSEILEVVMESSQLLRSIKESYAREQEAIVFMERVMNGHDMSFQVNQYKEAFPKIRIIVLTVDVERQRIMYLHEIGADNFIAKPVSANTIIEKIASTLKPQTRLGQLIDTARTLLRQGEKEKAHVLCDQLLELKPNSATGLMMLGDVYEAKGNIEKAIESYVLASKSADLFLEPIRRLAELSAKVGDKEGQLHYLEQLDKLSPLNSERKVNMGVLYLSKGNLLKASEYFETAVAQVTKEAMSQIGAVASRIAEAYSDSDPLSSEKFLRKALDVKGKYLSIEDISIFNQLGIRLRQQGKWKEAITEYERAIAVSPNDENLYYNMAMAFAEGKDFKSARLHMQKALSLNPDFPNAGSGIAYNMGVVFLQSGVRDKSRQCLEIALSLKPDFEAAKRALDKLGM